MASSLRWARRRARNAAALAQSAHVENLMQDRHVVRIRNIDGPSRPARIRPKSGDFRKNETSDISDLNFLPSEGALQMATPMEVEAMNTNLADFRVLCRRLRKLPLRQLGHSLPALHAQILHRGLSGTAFVSHFWSSISRRILVNSADNHFPVSTLALALPELQRLGLLSKVSALGKLVRGLARQASQPDHMALLPLLTLG